MALVEISINGAYYELACDDGQESNVRDLSMTLSSKVMEVARSVPHAGENLRLVMAALMALDELAETKRRLIAAQTEAEEASIRAAREKAAEIETLFAASLDSITRRIEKVSGILAEGETSRTTDGQDAAA